MGVIIAIITITSLTFLCVMLFHRDLRCELAKLKKAIDALKEKK